jgi:hypothetical protein
MLPTVVTHKQWESEFTVNTECKPKFTTCNERLNLDQESSLLATHEKTAPRERERRKNVTFIMSAVGIKSADH